MYTSVLRRRPCNSNFIHTLYSVKFAVATINTEHPRAHTEFGRGGLVWDDCCLGARSHDRSCAHSAQSRVDVM